MQARSTDPGAQLDREAKITAALLALLRQEQACLIEADVTGVTDLLNEKAQLVAQAADLAMARHQALAGVGLAANETGMQAWIASLDEGSEAVQCWKRLLGLAREAKEINRTNGLLINQQLIRNEAALSVLHGTPQSANVYGPNGQTASRPLSRGRVIG